MSVIVDYRNANGADNEQKESRASCNVLRHCDFLWILLPCLRNLLQSLEKWHLRYSGHSITFGGEMKTLAGSNHKEWGMSDFTFYVMTVRDVFGYRPMEVARVQLMHMFWQVTASKVNGIEHDLNTPKGMRLS